MPSILSRGFDTAGRMTSGYAYDPIGNIGLQNVSYQWGAVGNLSARSEQSGNKNLSESFAYDNLNRLTSATVAGRAANTVSYDSLGNITYKTGVGNYSYGAGAAGPHAVTNAGGVSYQYDSNGNNTSSSDGRNISYTAFDKPSQITLGGHTTSFAYGPDRARYLRTDQASDGATSQTLYLGSVEKITRTAAGGSTSHQVKRYIGGIAIITLEQDSLGVTLSKASQYLYKDHLGSIDVITDASGASGAIVQEQSFDAWGQRRNAVDWQVLSAGLLAGFDHASTTTRGFTGHEMLDEVGIIHMNGRIYDPRLGRFLQADPFIQSPTNSQSLNRYSYVLNNPLNATDPSGYFLDKLVKNKFLRIAFTITVGVLTYGAVSTWAANLAWTSSITANMTMAAAATTSFAIGGVVGGAVSGFVTGAMLTGSFKGAMQGAFSGAVFGGLGGYYKYSRAWNYKRVVANGLAGGVTSKASGGSFSDGLKMNLATSMMTLANYKMRLAMIEQSRWNPDNIGKKSKGFFGDNIAIAGVRRVLNPLFGRPGELKYLPCDGPAGGCQGQLIQEGDVGSRLGPVEYRPGDLLDTLAESFAGPHDWMSDKVGMYDGFGNGIYRGNGIEHYLYEGLSRVLVPFAAPFSAAALIDTSGVTNSMFYLRNGSN